MKMVSENPIFWILFIFQLIVWIVLNFTKIGRIISVGWGSTTLLGFIFMYTLGPYGINQAWNIGHSGNTTLMVQFTTKYFTDFFTDFVDLLIQLVLPPWAGLFLGLSISPNQNDTGGI